MIPIYNDIINLINGLIMIQTNDFQLDKIDSLESIIDFLKEEAMDLRSEGEKGEELFNYLELLIDYYELVIKWQPGISNFKYHSHFLPFDNFFAYPIALTHSLTNDSFRRIFCVDLETFLNIRWSINLNDLKWPAISLTTNRVYQNKRQLFVTLEDGTCKYIISIKKDVGSIEFVYNITNDILMVVDEKQKSPLYEHVKLLNQSNVSSSNKRVLDTIITTKDFLVISCKDNETQSNNRSTLTIIHLLNFTKKTILKWNRMRCSINFSITDLENEYAQEQKIGNLLMLDIRFHDSRVAIASIDLDNDDLEKRNIELENYIANFSYFVPMINGTRNLHIDLTCIGNEYFVISGVDDKHKIRTELINLKTGEKLENTKKPTAIYMVENLNDTLIGLVSVSETHIAFCNVVGNVIEDPKWEIFIQELTKFPYYPNVQTILIEKNLIVSIYGSAGFYIFCFNIENGDLLWRKVITEQNRFSHFDISFNILRNISKKTQHTIAICGSAKEQAFLFIQYQVDTGVELISNNYSWEDHEEHVLKYHQNVIGCGKFIINELNRQKRKKCILM